MHRERGYSSFEQAASAYERLAAAVADGRTNPAQPTYREDLED